MHLAAQTSGHGDLSENWISAADLTPGDRLVTADRSFAEVVAVRSEPQDNFKAYNLSVTDYETFFVRGDMDAEPVWVHNSGSDCNSNKLNHIFGNSSHGLNNLVNAFGGDKRAAFAAVQNAANAALSKGQLALGNKGIGPSAGSVFNIRGVLVQLSGGRAYAGNFSIGSFSSIIR